MRKTAGAPWGLARAWGVAHLVRGGRLSGYAPFLVMWTGKGGLSTRSFFVPKFCYIPDNLAAERTEKEVRITQFNYIYIYLTVAQWVATSQEIASAGIAAERKLLLRVVVQGPWDPYRFETGKQACVFPRSDIGSLRLQQFEDTFPTQYGS